MLQRWFVCEPAHTALMLDGQRLFTCIANFLYLGPSAADQVYVVNGHSVGGAAGEEPCGRRYFPQVTSDVRLTQGVMGCV